MDAQRLAVYIFYNLVGNLVQASISVEHFEEFFPGPLAQQAFQLFDRNDNKQVTLQEVETTALEMFREREFMARTLRDTHKIVTQLSRLIFAAMLVVCLYLTSIIWSSEVKYYWQTLTSAFISMSFIFGGSIKQLFEAAVFLFAFHPYDVGDAVLLDGTFYVVEELALLYNKFRRCDNNSQYMPIANILLMNVINLSRSGNLWESFEVMIDLDTPVAFYHDIREDLRKFLASDP